MLSDNVFNQSAFTNFTESDDIVVQIEVEVSDSKMPHQILFDIVRSHMVQILRK